MPKRITQIFEYLCYWRISENFEDEVFVLKDLQNNPFLIVGAVPFYEIGMYGLLSRREYRTNTHNLQKESKNISKMFTERRKTNAAS